MRYCFYGMFSVPAQPAVQLVWRSGFFAFANAARGQVHERFDAAEAYATH